MVLEAGERRERQARIRLHHDLADDAVGPGVGGHVDESEPVEPLTVARFVAVADELEAGAHREDHRAAGSGPLDRGAGRPHPGGRHHLRVVLPATEQVDVERLGNRGAGRDLDQLGVDPAPAAPLDEDDRVAAVAVGPEQLGVHEPDPDGRRSAFTTTAGSGG